MISVDRGRGKLRPGNLGMIQVVDHVKMAMTF